MDAYYPNSAWLCLHEDVFERLYQYKMQHGIPTWEEALERLLSRQKRGAFDESRPRSRKSPKPCSTRDTCSIRTGLRR